MTVNTTLAKLADRSAKLQAFEIGAEHACYGIAIGFYRPRVS
jgi:hypothetical protein